MNKLLLGGKPPQIPARVPQPVSRPESSKVNFCLWPLEDSLSSGEGQPGGPVGWQPARRAPGAAGGRGGLAATITLTLSPSQVQHICKWCQLICWLADGELRLLFMAQRRHRLLSLALTFLLEQMQRLCEFGCGSAHAEALRQF